MKSILYTKTSTDKLVYCEVEKPVPADHEVLVRVLASSVNAADYRSLKLGIIPKRKIFGADIAGVVESVGRDVTQFRPGDEVMGDLADSGFGGFAEYAAAPEKALVMKPAGLSFEEAAAIPLAGVTALQGLRKKGNIQPGQKVLIVGAGGGVGTFAVQLAKHFGAEVTAVCSTRNVEQTISLGADYVVDYTKEDVAKTGRTYDLILAVNGNRSLLSYKRLLNPGGIYVMVGGAMKQILGSLFFGWLFSFGSRKMRTLAAKPNREDLGFLAGLAGEGLIRPLIEATYPLSQTPEAMKHLSSGHARGKVVIRVE
jgi:NADPH:quinone reductase-like Zn-dependent oxidoreductase